MDVTTSTILCWMLSIVHLVQSQGYPQILDTKYVRDGGNITLSWNLDPVFLNEFTVRGPSMFNSIFHVIYFSQPTLVNETYESRVHGAAVMGGSELVFSFLLTDIGMSDGGTYSVFTGSPNTAGREVQSFRLFVTHVLGPYIVATDTVQYRSLTCYSFTVMSGEGALTTSHSWRKNNFPVESGGKYDITSFDGRSYNWEFYHVSTLAVRDVRESEMRDRYSCQATVDKLMVTVLSEEKTFRVTPALTDFPNTTVMKETDNVNLTWNIPRHDYDFYVYHHSGDLLLHVNETMIYTMDKYWSRIKISDVSTTSHSLIVQFTLYNVTSSDAGKLDSRVYHKEWHILPDWHHMLIVARKPEDPHIYSSGSLIAGNPLILMCSTLPKSLPVDHGQRMSYTWRRNSLLLESTNKYHYTGSTLIIGAFQDEWHYRGRYSCQANDLDEVSNWSAEYAVEETYTGTMVIFVILGSCAAVLVIVTVTVATFYHAYNVLKDSFHSTSVDNYITPVADTGISVDDVEANVYEMIDVGSRVDQITPIPNQPDVGSSDQKEPSSDDGGQGDSLDGTRHVQIVGDLELNELDFTSRQSRVIDDPSMSQSHVYYTTSVKDRRPQTDAAGYLPWNEAKGLLIREENGGPNYSHICDVMDLNEADFTSRSITVIRDRLTSQAHTYYNASENTKRPQKDAAGYLPWNEAKGMLMCEENNATEHQNNVDEVFYSDGSNVKQTNLNFENEFNE